jgi:WD40 repeat protein
MLRRQFLGSVAVATVTGLVCKVGYSCSLNEYDWKNEVVQTVGQPPKFLAPVVTDIALSPTESQLAVVGDDHFVSIYDIASKKFTQVLKGHTDWVRVSEFSPDGSILLTAGNDRRCLLWDTTKWTSPFQLTNHPAAIIDAAFSPASNHVALVGFEKTLRIYDWKTLEVVTELTCSTDDVHCVAYSLDGRQLAAAGRDGIIRVWDVATKTLVSDLKVHRQRIRSLEYLTNGNILSSSEDQFVRITNPNNGKVETELPRLASKLFCVASIDDARIATGGSDNQVTVWDIATKTKLGTLSAHTGTVSCLHRGKNLLISGSYDTQLRIWTHDSNTNTSALGTQSSTGWNSRLK